MNKVILTLLLMTSLASAATVAMHYVADPNETTVSNVHYDPDLKMVVIHVHAKVMWFHVEEIYGLKIKDDSTIEKDWLRIIGDQPEVIHLKAVK